MWYVVRQSVLLLPHCSLRRNTRTFYPTMAAAALQQQQQQQQQVNQDDAEGQTSLPTPTIHPPTQKANNNDNNKNENPQTRVERKGNMRHARSIAAFPDRRLHLENITRCFHVWGFPLFLSLPHFLLP